MKKNLYLMSIVIILLFPFINANALENCNANELSCLNIQINIKANNYENIFVVSDSIYFNITFKNEYPDKNISEILVIELLDPSENILYLENYPLDLIPNETKSMLSKGGFEGELSAIPLNSLGTYTLKIKSTKYSFYEVLENGKWIRYTNEFSYSFDTMPRWQYDLWKSEQNSNDELIDLTEDLKVSLDKSSESSNKMYRATIFLLIIGLIQVLFITSQVMSSRDSLRSFLKIVLTILFVVGLLFLTLTLIFSLTTEGFSLFSKIIMAFIIIIAIIFVFRDFIKAIKKLGRNNLESFR